MNKVRNQELFDLALGRYSECRPSKSSKFDHVILSSRLPSPSYTTSIDIENIDTISAVLSTEGKTLVLNMANANVPGGGYLNGALAQEEDLFRRTNLFRTLTSDIYPMRADEVIYTPVAHIFRDGHWNIIAPREVAFISVAAICCPVLQPDGTMHNEDLQLMYDKIRCIFHIGALYGIENLVLGALGCGVFRNPPNQIAKAFADVIKEYDGYFKTVKFAILSTGRNRNYDIFRQVFSESFGI